MSTGVNPNVQTHSWGAISMPTPALRLSPRATPEWKRVQPLSRGLVPESKPCVEVSPNISSRKLLSLAHQLWLLPEPPRSPPSAPTQLTLQPTPLAPPTGGEPVGRGTHVVCSGYARPSSMGTGPATRCSLPGPTPGPGSRGGPNDPLPGQG